MAGELIIPVGLRRVVVLPTVILTNPAAEVELLEKLADELDADATPPPQTEAARASRR